MLYKSILFLLISIRKACLDRNRIWFVWLLSFCFIIAPFWSVSKPDKLLTDDFHTEEPLEETSLETAFDMLDEDVQSELIFKRFIIGAIDVSLEVNEALWLYSSGTFQRIAIILPSWIIVRSAYFVQRGFLSDLRSITPDKKNNTGAFKNFIRDVRKHFNAQKDLRKAQIELDDLRKQAVTKATEELVPRQERLVETLQKEVNNLKSRILQSSKESLKIKSIPYKIGRNIRLLGSAVIVLAGLPIYVAVIGNTVTVVFDTVEEMEVLKDRYLQDIKEIVDSSFPSS